MFGSVFGLGLALDVACRAASRGTVTLINMITR